MIFVKKKLKTDQSSQYFRGLNYTLANEDTTFELTLAKHYRVQRILTVCGSGGRSLPFLSLNPQSLTLVDLSQDQLDLARFKAAALSQLDFETYCLFWGFPPFHPEENSAVRRQIFDRLDLEDDLRERFDHLLRFHQDHGLLYQGLWEQKFTIVPIFLRRYLGPIIATFYDTLFEFRDLASQRRYLEKTLQNPLWKALPRAIILGIGNAHYFNTFLYKGAMVNKNIPQSSFDFYRQAFRRAMGGSLARENFFLQLSFFGKIVFPEANPPEAQKDVYEASQKALGNVSLRYLKCSVIPTESQALTSYDPGGPFDFVSLSDVPSYLTGSLEQNYLQNLRPFLKPGAIVVSRCYLRIPENTNLQGFTDITSTWQQALELEKTQMYHIFVFRFDG